MQVGMVDRQAIRRRWEAVGSKLDERGRRMFAAGEALVAGWGGLEAVSEITGLARSTIGRGKKELDAAPLPKGRVRRDGAGRPDLSSRDTMLVEDLLGVIEPVTLGAPVRPMLWVAKSHEKLADALQKKGPGVSASSVKRLLPTLGYSRQSRGLEASRPQCAIRAHQRQGHRGAGRGTARHLGRHQEERADRQLQERWHRLSSEG